MKKSILTASVRAKICVICIFFLPSLLFCRPFDWQYDYVSVPFAVFYNPSLIGNNAGYVLGLDARYENRENHDGRFAAVIPVDNAVTLEEIRDGVWGYDNSISPYIFSRHAISVGGMYTSGDNYFATMGFTAPIYKKYPIKSGVSADFAYNPSIESPAVSLNAAVSAPVADENLVTLTAHNFFASARNYENFFGLSIGAAGALYSNPYLFLMPYDFQYSFYFDRGKVYKTEGVARLSFDFTPALAGREKTGLTAALSCGYGFVNYADGKSEGKIYAALGIALVNRASLAEVWGGYGRKEGGYGALIYNLFGESSRTLFAKDEFSVVLKYSETDSGQIIFTADCRGGTNMESWVLWINGAGGRTVTTFSGKNVPPAAIHWDRLDSGGNPLKQNEPVHARIVVKRRNGTVVESNQADITARE